MTSHNQSTGDGHSFYNAPFINRASVAYIAILIVYSGFLAYGLSILFRHRHKQPMRVRGYGIMVAAVLAIHFYVAALFIVYPLNQVFKCGTEFWIMSTALPLSMALFQASNVRLMAYAKLQHELAEMECYSEMRREPVPCTFTGIKKWISGLRYVKKTYFWICAGLVVQLCLTFFLFFGSRRFNPNTGFFGKHVDRMACRQGFEWIPSAVWQFLWTWIIGPVILFKTRHIKDTHFWALQTRICIIAGLPGTPMWLCFLYIPSPALARINPWWPPAMWFAPGLMTMCISSLVFPSYDIYRRATSGHSGKSSNSSISRFSVAEGNTRSRTKETAHSLGAFDFQLKHNSTPLLHFAATKDFTSENILFLREVRDFKLKWRRHVAMSPSLDDCLSDAEMREMYEDAARIYFELINPETATISVNLDGHMYDEFEVTFSHIDYEPPREGKRTQSTCGDTLGTAKPKNETTALRQKIAPWDTAVEPTTPNVVTTDDQNSTESETAIIPIALDSPRTDESHQRLPVPPICEVLGISVEEFERICGDSKTQSDNKHSKKSNRSPDKPNFNLAPSNGQPNPKRPRGRIYSKPNGSHLTRERDFVPSAFSLNIFDTAYQQVKYLVYHNTWKSYINTLSDEGIQRLVMIYSCGGNYVPRRCEGASDNPISHMTDVELYDLNLELQAERDGTDKNQVHHGVLDAKTGPVPMLRVDARCSGCRSGSRIDKIQHIIGIGPSHNYSVAK